MGLGGKENTSEVEGGGKVFRAADSDDGPGVERSAGEHVVVWRGRSAGAEGQKQRWEARRSPSRMDW